MSIMLAIQISKYSNNDKPGNNDIIVYSTIVPVSFNYYVSAELKTGQILAIPAILLNYNRDSLDVGTNVRDAVVVD